MDFGEIGKICGLYSASGDESQVREYIISQIKDYADYKTDPLGNLIVFKKGKEAVKNGKKLMLSAHMDEVGFVITHINSDGTLRFAPVGGISSDVVSGRQVYIKSADICGVIGSKPVHKLSREQRSEKPEIESMYIDIGAVSDEEAKQIVNPGDYVYFTAGIKKLGGNKIMSKAIDDRAGCQMLIDIIKSDTDYDVVCLFSVQEEIGLRGARAAAYSVNPDYAVVFETTTAADLDGASESDEVCSLGKGAVISYCDKRTMYDRELYNLAVKTAEKNNIRWQTKTKIAGGNDSGAIQTSRGGTKVIAISVPCRYLHSPSVVMQSDDYDSVFELGKKLIGEISEL